MEIKNLKIGVYLSGHQRTLKHGFNKNLALIRKTFPYAEVHVFFSLWSEQGRSKKINDPWHFRLGNLMDEKPCVRSITEYLLESGVNSVVGEIENAEKMISIINQSPLCNESKTLSCQYYKIYRCAKIYPSENFDLCFRIRPDILISRVPNFNEESHYEDTLFVSFYYWYLAPFIGKDCNEMIWACSGKSFLQSCSLFVHLTDCIKKMPNQEKFQYGENITGTYFEIIKKQFGTKVTPFNFNYRVAR